MPPLAAWHTAVPQTGPSRRRQDRSPPWGGKISPGGDITDQHPEHAERLLIGCKHPRGRIRCRVVAVSRGWGINWSSGNLLSPGEGPHWLRRDFIWEGHGEHTAVPRFRGGGGGRGPQGLPQEAYF